MPPSVLWSCVAGSGPKVRPCFVGLVAQVVEDAARLDAGDAALGVDLENAVQVFREIDHDGGVAALAGEARAAAARQDRRVVAPADRDGLARRLPRVFGITTPIGTCR